MPDSSIRLRPAAAAFVVALSLFTVFGGPATAELCAIDVVPARTLLLPYWEVDLTKLNKPKRTEVTTAIVTNVSDEEIFAHVTLWTDIAIPIIAWDIPLAPLASVEIPLYEVLRGNLPGLHPDFPEVAGISDPAELQAAFSGQAVASRSGMCLGLASPNLARGYMTIDATVRDGGFGSPQNFLIGEIRTANRRKKYAGSEPLIHVEQGANRVDDLPKVWGARFDTRGGSKTSLVVWRDLGGADDYTCGSPEDISWYPAGQEQVVAADAEGNVVELGIDDDGTVIPLFSAVTGVYEIGTGPLRTPTDFGWLYLDLGDPENQFATAVVSTLQIVDSGKRRGRAPAAILVGPCDD